MSGLTKQAYMSTTELIAALKQGRARVDALSIEGIDAVQIFPNYRGGDAIAILLGAIKARDQKIERLSARQIETEPADKPIWSHCCENRNQLFIQSGRAAGSGITEHHSVYVCANCGKFEVCGDQNFQRYRVAFSLWSPEILEAAGKAFKLAELTEKGEIGHYLARLEAIANELSQYLTHGDNPEPSHQYPGWFNVLEAERALMHAIEEARKSLEGHGGK